MTSDHILKYFHVQNKLPFTTNGIRIPRDVITCVQIFPGLLHSISYRRP